MFLDHPNIQKMTVLCTIKEKYAMFIIQSSKISVLHTYFSHIIYIYIYIYIYIFIRLLAIEQVNMNSWFLYQCIHGLYQYVPIYNHIFPLCFPYFPIFFPYVSYICLIFFPYSPMFPICFPYVSHMCPI